MSIIAVINKHTAKLHRVDSLYTITMTLLSEYFTLLRKVINLKMARNWNRNMSLNETMEEIHPNEIIELCLSIYCLYF